jgi:hypothetical protein
MIAKKKREPELLVELLEAARPEMLIQMIVAVAENRPDVRGAYLDYLKKHLTLSTAQKNESEGEIIMGLWDELYPDLQEFYEYGGGDYHKEEEIIELLEEIQEKLEASEVEAEVRQGLLEELLPFIIHSNAGLDDQFYALACATCRSDDEWRSLAQVLENINQDWSTSGAREIYRKLGDREKYLELRRQKMVYVGDYGDLAKFYWDEGSRNEAISVAAEGMKRGVGRKDELRTFFSDRALEDGNREQYLALQFEIAADRPSLEKYNTVKKICSAEEWALFEPKIVEQLAASWPAERLGIRMAREEYDEALAILLKGNYPSDADDSCAELLAAKQLEQRFPEQILAYYLSGLGNLNRNATRHEYTVTASVMVKVRSMMVDVIKEEARWKVFASKVKGDNLRRPAFQEEFGRVIAGWEELVPV